MTEFQDIQRLIRLKRFETPGEDFVEDFVNQFRERQRSELLRQSARGLLWERMNTYFEHLLAPKWATAGVTAALCLLGTWAALNFMAPSNHRSTLAAMDTSELVGPLRPSLEVDSPLIQQVANAEAETIDIESVLISRQMDFGPEQLAARVDPATTGSLLPVVLDFE
jgi:hypothetical protein